MSRVALSLSPCTKRANSGCVMLIGSPPCFVIQSRKSGPPITRLHVAELIRYVS